MPPPPDFDAFDDSFYHYVPTQYVTIIFIVLFGLTTLAHLSQALYFRLWWLLPTAVVAGIGEIIGWSGRFWSSLNYGMLRTPFLMQISAIIFSPTFLLAAYFILLGRLILLLGPQYSRLNYKLYTWIFLTADLIALIVQAAGGGIASSKDSKIGGNIMLGGIIFQFVAMVIFVSLATEFIIRYAFRFPLRRREAPISMKTLDALRSDSSTEVDDKGPRIKTKMRLLLIGVYFSLTCLLIRAIYRTIELSDGWSGRIIATEVYFNILDAMMVFLALFALNVLHPGWLLNDKQSSD